MSTDTTVENLEGTAKELAGKVVGDEDLETAGRQQQEKARKQEQAAELRDEAEQKEKQAEGHAGAEAAADDR